MVIKNPMALLVKSRDVTPSPGQPANPPQKSLGSVIFLKKFFLLIKAVIYLIKNTYFVKYYYEWVPELLTHPIHLFKHRSYMKPMQQV